MKMNSDGLLGNIDELTPEPVKPWVKQRDLLIDYADGFEEWRSLTKEQQTKIQHEIYNLNEKIYNFMRARYLKNNTRGAMIVKNDITKEEIYFKDMVKAAKHCGIEMKHMYHFRYSEEKSAFKRKGFSLKFVKPENIVPEFNKK